MDLGEALKSLEKIIVREAMEVRRVQRTSDGTCFVTLPKSWVTLHAIEKGSLLTFSEGKDSKLTVGVYSEKDKPSRTITFMATQTLDRGIEEKYLLGYDLIQIESKQAMDSQLRDKAKSVLKMLVGLEIVEEDAHKIVIQCLIEPALLAPEKVIRRLHFLTKGMEEDAVVAFVSSNAKLAATVVERDEEVDRLYFLLVRMVRAALTDLSIAERIHANPVDCLDYRLLSSLIEHFGDYAASVAQNVPAEKSRIPAPLVRSLQKAGEAVNLMYRSSIDAVLARNSDLASEVDEMYTLALEKIRETERAIVGLRPEVLDKTTSAVAALKSMCEIGKDIADLAMTR